MMLDRRECSRAEFIEVLRSQQAKVICSSQDLVGRLQLLFAEAQNSSGIKSWPVAMIHSEFAWMYDQLRLASAQAKPWVGQGFSLVEPVQADLLWQAEIASNSQEKTDIIDFSLLIDTVKRSYVAMKRLDVSLEAASLRANTEQSMFLAWCRGYEARCRDARWYDPAQLPAYFHAALEAGLIDTSVPIWLLGFDHFSPTTSAYLKALEQAGQALQMVSVAQIKHSDKDALWFAHWDDEVAAISHWAAEQLQDDLSAQVFVALPASKALCADVEDAITFHLQSMPKPMTDVVCNAHARDTLLEHGALQQALAWIALSFRRLEFHELGFILRQNHGTESSTEMSARAHFEIQLRDQQIFPLGFEALIDAAKNFAASNESIDGLLKQLEALKPFRDQWSNPLSLSAWALEFSRLLAAVQWLPEEEDGCGLKHRWSQAMDILAQLVAGAREYNIAKAQRLLRDVLTAMPADEQKYPKLQRRVQIIGYEEAAAFPKASMWIAAAVNEAWPVVDRFDPLLSASLQFEQDQARLEPSKALARHRLLAAQLLNSAQHVVLSGSGQREGQEQTQCKLLFSSVLKKVYAADRFSEKSKIFAVQSKHQASVALEPWQDEPSENEKELSHISLSSRGLELQAQCPFRGFVETRLDGKRLEYASRSLNRRQQGIYLHRTLEHFWRTVKTQQALQILAEDEQLDNSIKSALDSALPLQEGATQALRRLERQRLASAVKSWLMVELERESFSVHALEKKYPYKIFEHQINIRIDRMDMTQSGAVLIDYKSSKPLLSDLLADRLLAPQLALYALAVENNPVAVSYATINLREQRFFGLSAQDGVLPQVRALQKNITAKKLKLDWQGLHQRWRQQLEALTIEWSDRVVHVAPVKGDESCRQCHLRSVCRRDELQANG